MSTERWIAVPIEPFTNLYEVSDLGRVRALDRYITEEKTGKKRFHAGRIITPKRSGKYLGITLFAKPHVARFYIHRLVALCFVPNPENKPHVNHKNRNKNDNSAVNLEWVTPIENTAHAFASRNWNIPAPKGTEAYSAKLDDEKVKEIRLSWKPGSSIKELSIKYGVTNRAIYQVLHGNTWKHVTPKCAINWRS